MLLAMRKLADQFASDFEQRIEVVATQRGQIHQQVPQLSISVVPCARNKSIWLAQ
jgi:hypothetical protein